METEKTEMYKYENQPEEPLLSHEPHSRQTYIQTFETKELFATITTTSATTNTTIPKNLRVRKSPAM